MTARARMRRLALGAGRTFVPMMALVVMPRIGSAQSVNHGFDPNAIGKVDALIAPTHC